LPLDGIVSYSASLTIKGLNALPVGVLESKLLNTAGRTHLKMIQMQEHYRGMDKGK
jgi:hypothetical protein